MSDLFVLPPHVIAAAAIRARHKRRGHAGQPGTGPAGETCKSCKWIARKEMAKTYIKCGHRMAPRHTGGPGTDVRAGDPACERWEKVDV